MMKDDKTNANRQVHFANGFPSKGLVQAIVPYDQSSYTSPVVHYVSLVCYFFELGMYRCNLGSVQLINLE